MTANKNSSKNFGLLCITKISCFAFFTNWFNAWCSKGDRKFKGVCGCCRNFENPQLCLKISQKISVTLHVFSDLYNSLYFMTWARVVYISNWFSLIFENAPFCIYCQLNWLIKKRKSFFNQCYLNFWSVRLEYVYRIKMSFAVRNNEKCYLGAYIR